MKTKLLPGILLAAGIILVPGLTQGDYAGSILRDAVKDGMELKDNQSLKAAGYSPYAGKNYPTRVLWGDTHLHTKLSLDARAFGVTLGPAEAYQFARGDEITTSHGERIKLSRPLDWLVVSDHSDAMGAMDEVVAGNAKLGLPDTAPCDALRRPRRSRSSRVDGSRPSQIP